MTQRGGRQAQGEPSAAYFRRSGWPERAVLGVYRPFSTCGACRYDGARRAKPILHAYSRWGDKLCKTAQLVFGKGREEVN